MTDSSLGSQFNRWPYLWRLNPHSSSSSSQHRPSFSRTVHLFEGKAWNGIEEIGVHRNTICLPKKQGHDRWPLYWPAVWGTISLLLNASPGLGRMKNVKLPWGYSFFNALKPWDMWLMIFQSDRYQTVSVSSTAPQRDPPLPFSGSRYRNIAPRFEDPEIDFGLLKSEDKGLAISWIRGSEEAVHPTK